MIANKNALIEFFSLELFREKFKISWKTHGKLREFSFSKNLVTLPGVLSCCATLFECL